MQSWEIESKGSEESRVEKMLKVPNGKKERGKKKTRAVEVCGHVLVPPFP